MGASRRLPSDPAEWSAQKLNGRRVPVSDPVRPVTLPRAMRGGVCKIGRGTAVDESSCRDIALAAGSLVGGFDARNIRKA